MSLMLLGYKMKNLKDGIKDGRYNTRADVKDAAKQLDVAGSYGYDDLSPELEERWYQQLAVNLFDNHNNCIPTFIDLGFGIELLDRMTEIRNHIPQKEHWKLVVTRKGYPDWQFNAIATCYTREEAVAITKYFFRDIGTLGLSYEDPTPKTEHKAPWVELTAKKRKYDSYREYVEKQKEEQK